MKEILEANGFSYNGKCKVCGGQAELFKKDGIVCKINIRSNKFELIINNNKIKGNAKDLQGALATYLQAA